MLGFGFWVEEEGRQRKGNRGKRREEVEREEGGFLRGTGLVHAWAGLVFLTGPVHLDFGLVF